MNIEDMPLNQTKTLAERLSEGRMPVGEALKCAMQLADSLRKLHDQGKAHGAITPSNVALAADGVELLPTPSTASIFSAGLNIGKGVLGAPVSGFRGSVPWAPVQVAQGHLSRNQVTP